jgi:hypothetical protein
LSNVKVQFKITNDALILRERFRVGREGETGERGREIKWE